MALKLTNNAASVLAAPITSSATTLAIAPGDGSKFPSLGAGDWFPLVVIKVDGTLEIMRCTARTNDTLTVTRAQEGTAAVAFAAGDRVELRLTSAALAGASVDTATTATAATTATRLQTARTLTVGNTGKAFDGSANLSWSLDEIGVTAFGLGGAAASVPGDNIDASSIPTGFYYVTTTTSGTKPPGDDGFGHLIVSREGGGVTARQVYLDNTVSRIWTRVWAPSQWSGWSEIAFLDSPAFTGTPTAPTPGLGDNSTKIATTAFLRNEFVGSGRQSLAMQGYQRLPGGLILQWGRVSATVGTNGSITFPLAFGGLFTYVAAPEMFVGSGYVVRVYSPSNTGFSYGWDWVNTNGNGVNCIINWIAIGT